MAKRTKTTKQKEEVTTLLDAIIKGIREKKGKMIRQMDLTGLGNASSDYFIIAHGDSQRQAQAIADSIEHEVKESHGEKPWHVEGMQNAQWILIDYVNVVAHIFFKETRDFYDLESLWADAVVTEISEEEEIVKKEVAKKVVKAKEIAPVSKAKPKSPKKTEKPAIKKTVKTSVKKAVAKTTKKVVKKAAPKSKKK